MCSLNFICSPDTRIKQQCTLIFSPTTALHSKHSHRLAEINSWKSFPCFENVSACAPPRRQNVIPTEEEEHQAQNTMMERGGFECCWAFHSTNWLIVFMTLMPKSYSKSTGCSCLGGGKTIFIMKFCTARVIANHRSNRQLKFPAIIVIAIYLRQIKGFLANYRTTRLFTVAQRDHL